MAAIAVFGANVAVVRVYLLAETNGKHLDPFNFGFLMFFALQLGLWRCLRTQGSRRFWLGLVAAGLAATAALLIILGGDIELDNWYTGASSDLTYFCLPAPVDVMLTNEHWDWFLAIIYFLPELLAAVLGGLLAASLFGVGRVRLPEPAL
jgi:hypothetical protein